MGEGKQRGQAAKLNAARTVTVDLAGPKYFLTAGDRRAFAQDNRTELVEARVTRHVMQAVIGAAFPVDPRTGQGGMDRTDGEFWGTWIQALAFDDEPPDNPDHE